MVQVCKDVYLEVCKLYMRCLIKTVHLVVLLNNHSLHHTYTMEHPSVSIIKEHIFCGHLSALKFDTDCSLSVYARTSCNITVITCVEKHLFKFVYFAISNQFFNRE